MVLAGILLFLAAIVVPGWILYDSKNRLGEFRWGWAIFACFSFFAVLSNLQSQSSLFQGKQGLGMAIGTIIGAIAGVVALYRGLTGSKQQEAAEGSDSDSPVPEEVLTNDFEVRPTAMVGDSQRFYDQVAEELKSGHRISGLWVRASAESDGEPMRTEAAYIKLRVAQIQAEKAQKVSGQESVTFASTDEPIDPSANASQVSQNLEQKEMDSQHSFFGLSLPEGVMPIHLVVFLLVAFAATAVLHFQNIVVPEVLRIFQIPTARQGDLVGQLTLVQESVFVLTMAVIGAMADKFGRRILLGVGIVTLSLGIGLYAFVGSVVQLFLVRGIVAIGGATVVTLLLVVITDYSRDSTRGFANGLFVMMLALGLGLSGTLAALPNWFAERGFDELSAFRAAIFSVSGIGLIAAVLTYLCSAKSAGNSRNTTDSILGSISESFSKIRDPQISLSLLSALGARATQTAIGTFLILWIVQYGTNELNMNAASAMARGGIIFGVLATGGLIFPIIIGAIFDRVDRVVGVRISCAMTVLAAFSVGLMDDPTTTSAMYMFFVMGVAQSAGLISSQALIGHYAESKLRGSAIGQFAAAGAVGVVLASLAGGILFDQFGGAGPFLFIAVLNLALLVFSLLVRESKKSKASIYAVFSRGDQQMNQMVRVKQGFNWAALFLGPLWAWYKGMVAVGFFILLGHIVVAFVAGVIVQAFVAAGLPFGMWVAWVISLFWILYYSGCGNAWLCKSLVGRGFEFVRYDQ